jgi:very-short-patch-repair endonuclease
MRAGGEGRKPLLERARSLRSNQTEAEQRLWYYLRARRFSGLKFKRQKLVGNYIVDFVCFSPKLIVEVDGSQHAEQEQYDDRRDQWLRNEGFIVLHLWNNQVLGDIEAVLGSIRETVVSLNVTT